MRLTSQADYALRIINSMAIQNEKLDTRQISERTGVPLRFTIKILRTLKQSKIVDSIKGAMGGYILSRKAQQISYLDVIESIDGRVLINKCIDETYCCNNPANINNANCEMQEFLFSLNEEIENKLKNKKFGEKEEKKL